MTPAATTAPAVARRPPPRHPSVPRVPVADGDLVTALEHEWLAENSDAAWLEVGDSRHAAAYFDPADGPATADRETLYVFPELRGDLAEWGVISGPVFASAHDVKHMRLVELDAPVRYLRRPDGKLDPGFFEPAHGVFFRWRGQVRDPETVEFYSEREAVPRVVNPARVSQIVDVDPPPRDEAGSREQSWEWTGP